MKQAKINQFAKENGYDSAEYLCEWRGYSCYEPFFKGDEVSNIGLPLLILVDENENIRMSTPDEAMKQIDEMGDQPCNLETLLEKYVATFHENFEASSVCVETLRPPVAIIILVLLDRCRADSCKRVKGFREAARSALDAVAGVRYDEQKQNIRLIARRTGTAVVP